MIRRLFAILTCAGSLAFTGLPALADEHGDKEKAGERQPRCLSMSRIDRVEIIDDETLLFHMTGKKKYVNHLPYKCHGLKSEGTFLHETSLQSYCDLDTISVLDTSIGMRLGSCPLGEFKAYTEEDEKQKAEEK